MDRRMKLSHGMRPECFTEANMISVLRALEKGFKNNFKILLLVYVTLRASGPDAALMCCRVDLKSETGQLSFHRVKKINTRSQQLVLMLQMSA